MKDLEVLNPSAYKNLKEKDLKTKSRAFFLPRRCCDVMENEISESFNALIVDAIKNPFIIVLEELRLYMMARVYTMKL